MSSVANELDLLSSQGSDRQSVAQRSHGSRSHHSRDHHNSGYESDRDLDGNDDGRSSHHPSRHSRIVELNSPVRSMAGISGIGRGGQTEKRSRDPSVQRDTVPKGPEGKETLKPHDPFENIADSRKCKANTEVFNAFVGHPEKRDPAHIKLNEPG